MIKTNSDEDFEDIEYLLIKRIIRHKSGAKQTEINI